MVGNGKRRHHQLDFKGLAPLGRKFLTHRQRELARQKWRVANRKRVAQLIWSEAEESVRLRR